MDTRGNRDVIFVYDSYRCRHVVGVDCFAAL